MNWWRGISSLAARAAGTIGRTELPAGGRSSLEPAATLGEAVQTLSSHFGGLAPYAPHVLALLESLAIHSPVVSQAVKLIGTTVNTGHEIQLEGPKRQVDQARDLLGDLARRVYRRSAGVDGLINHYTRQLAVSGALASEDVLEPDFSAVREVALLPVSAIRFKWRDQGWTAQQLTQSSGTVDLNDHTFAYYALDTLPGHPPYAVPPFVAAIEPERLQRDFLHDLRTYAKKLGIYGVTSIKVPPPERRPGETTQEYEDRAQQHLAQVAAAYDGLLSRGLLVMPDNHEIEHKSVTSGASGVDKISQGVEQLLMSALNIDPAMFGRSFSTTETYAGVVYGLLLRWAAQYQRLIKRRMERTYLLALLLAGLHQVDVTLAWDPQPELDKADAASAEQTRQSMILERRREGIIDADQAAQELGYEKAAVSKATAGCTAAQAGPAARLSLRLEPGSDRYQPVRISLASPPPEDDEAADLAAERKLQARAEALATAYRGQIAPLVEAVRAQALDAAQAILAGGELGQEMFVARVYDALVETHVQAWSTPEALNTVRQAVEPVYRQLRLLTDLVGGGRKSWTWGGPDQRVLDFSARLDNFYISKYLDNPEAQRAAFRVLREQYLEQGAGLFGSDPGARKAFRDALGGALADLDDRQIARIVDTSVMRLRSWAAVQQLAESGATWAQVWAVLDNKTSAICREMHGRVFRVDAAAAEVKLLAGLSPSAFAATVSNADEAVVRREGLAGLQARNQLLPPYHPNCRTRVKLALEDPNPAPMPEGLSEDQQRAWRYWQELGPAAQRFRIADAADAEFKIGKRTRHAARHREVGDYDQATRELLTAPQRVLIRMEANGNYQLGLMSGDENNWRFGIIDPTYRIGATDGPPRLKSVYGPTPERPASWTKRSGQLARNNGWVEVMP